MLIFLRANPRYIVAGPQTHSINQAFSIAVYPHSQKGGVFGSNGLAFVSIGEGGPAGKGTSKWSLPDQHLPIRCEVL